MWKRKVKDGYISGKLKVLSVSDKKDKHGHILYNTICGCGKEVLVTGSDLLKKNGRNTKSCGCLKTDKPPKLLNQKINKLTVIGWGTRTKSSKMVRCLCDCGNFYETRERYFKKNSLYSCGCISKFEDDIKKIIGTKVNKLKILRVSNFTDKGHRLYCDVICDCGVRRTIRASKLVKGNFCCRVHCGNCSMMKNGVKTSQKALKLHKIIGKGIHNYNILVKNYIRKRLNVDIALIDEKIAIEYDGWYWHKNTEEKDLKKTEILINNNWKVLRIKSKNLLPTKKQINKSLTNLRNGNSKFETIIMEDYL